MSKREEENQQKRDLDSQQSEDESTEAVDESVAEEEASAAFASGFAKVSGEESPVVEEPVTEEPVKAKTEEPEPAVAADDSETQEPTDLDKANARIEKMEGRIGSLLQQVTNLSAAQQKSVASQSATTKESDEAPSGSQVSAALKNDDTLKELIEEFPSFEPVITELKAIREESQGAGVQEVDTDRLVEQATNNAIHQIENEALTRAYPDWTEEVKGAGFKKWSIDGGPTETEFAQLQTISQYDEAQANAILGAWQTLHPEWWIEKGQPMFSSRPSDTHRIMESFRKSTASKFKLPPKPKDKSRLEKAVQPKGTSEAPTTGISDSDAFARGFKTARGRRL